MKNVSSKLGLENTNANIQVISAEEMKNIEGGAKRNIINPCMWLYYLLFKYVI